MSQKYEYDEKTQSYTPIDENKTVAKDVEHTVAVVLWAIQFVSATVWPIIVTVLLYIYMKDKSKYLEETAKEVLNFELSLLIYVTVSGILTFILIGIPLLVAVGIYGIIVPILGIIAASNNTLFSAPFVFRFIK